MRRKNISADEMKLSLSEAITRARTAGAARFNAKPGDTRIRGGSIYCELFPKFSLPPGATVFTIGSCFARSVEEKLPGFELPTMAIAVPKTERLGRPNGILNEYNPGAMCQRIEVAACKGSFSNSCIVEEKGGFLDLLLPEYTSPVSLDRVLARRAEVDEVYCRLFDSEAIIITLDTIECWYDTASQFYLNRIPPPAVLHAERNRYELQILEFSETHDLLVSMVQVLLGRGVNRIILTVSPVPLDLTYSGKDCHVANCYSKSVLIACAQELSSAYSQIDYFPGFEIAASYGSALFEQDGIHVRDDVVEEVTAYMVNRYVR